tara:strand:+ start:3217 stop:3609 length:393 start_codon:yes stop_codon:yes gene_type:complete
MKKSELRKLIREELQLLQEAKNFNLPTPVITALSKIRPKGVEFYQTANRRVGWKWTDSKDKPHDVSVAGATRGGKDFYFVRAYEDKDRSGYMEADKKRWRVHDMSKEPDAKAIAKQLVYVIKTYGRLGKD